MPTARPRPNRSPFSRRKLFEIKLHFLGPCPDTSHEKVACRGKQSPGSSFYFPTLGFGFPRTLGSRAGRTFVKRGVAVDNQFHERPLVAHGSSATTL